MALSHHFIVFKEDRRVESLCRILLPQQQRLKKTEEAVFEERSKNPAGGLKTNKRVAGHMEMNEWMNENVYISPKTSGTLLVLLSLPSKANSRHFSSQNISVKPHCPSLLSVFTVCVCVCVCVCI